MVLKKVLILLSKKTKNWKDTSKILRKGTNSISSSNNRTILKEKGNTLGKNHKKYKKVVYEEESDSEAEVEESQYVPVEEFIEEGKEEETKQPVPKRKNKIFDYLNKDAKRNKR